MKNFYLQNLQLVINSLPKYTRVKRIIQNLISMTFCSFQDNKPLSKRTDLIIVKEKLIMVAKNTFVSYIFSKVYL